MCHIFEYIIGLASTNTQSLTLCTIQIRSNARFGIAPFTYLIPDRQVAEFCLAAPLEAQLERVDDVDVEECCAVVDGVVEPHDGLLGVVEGLEAVRALQVGPHHAAVADPV